MDGMRYACRLETDYFFYQRDGGVSTKLQPQKHGCLDIHPNTVYFLRDKIQIIAETYMGLKSGRGRQFDNKTQKMEGLG